MWCQQLHELLSDRLLYYFVAGRWQLLVLLAHLQTTHFAQDGDTGQQSGVFEPQYPGPLHELAYFLVVDELEGGHLAGQLPKVELQPDDALLLECFTGLLLVGFHAAQDIGHSSLGVLLPASKESSE